MNGSDRDISQWDARLKEQIDRHFHNYHIHKIDLTIERKDELVNWAGESLIVENVSSSSAIANVRLNFKDADQLTLKEGIEIKSIFGRVYLSNDAQAGEWLEIIAGINFSYKKEIAEAGGNGGITLANNEIQITWSAANSLSIAAGNNATSDAFVFSTIGSFAHIQIKADNDGTPAAGDTVDFFLLLTCGDPDGAGADEYDTVNHAIPLGTLDTDSEDPATRTVNCPMVKGGKLYAVNNSAGRAITVSACILEKTVS